MTQDEQIKALESRVALLERIVSLGISPVFTGKKPSDFPAHLAQYDKLNADLGTTNQP